MTEPRTIILYATRHGCAEKCAERIAERLSGPVEIVPLRKGAGKDLSGYDRVVLGGSIHAGAVQKTVRRLIEHNRAALLAKPLGLYLCCMREGAEAREQFERAWPERLRNHARAAEILGGEFDFSRMNFIERFITRKLAGVNQSVSKIDDEKIAAFCRALEEG